MAHADPIRPRILAILLIAGVLAASSGFHVDSDDLLCSAAPVHDASAHRLEAARNKSARQPTHCALCHWQRSFRTVLVLVHALDVAVDCASDVNELDVTRQIHRFERALPPRAPPA